MTFERFMKKNVEVKKNLRFAASDRFTEEDGSPLMWEIKALSTKEFNQIKNESMVTVKGRKGGMPEETINDGLFTAKFAARCTVVPDLYNAALQDSYGVKTPEELIVTMLNSGEFAHYQNVCLTHSGFDKDINDEIEEAKN